MGDGPGEYNVGPLPGQPDPLGEPSGSFFSGNWVGSTNQVVDASLIPPGATDGWVTSTGDGRAGRYLASPWDNSTSGTYYLSFEANFGALSNPATDGMGYRSAEFWPAGATIDVDVGRMEIGYNQYIGSMEQRDPETARLQWVVQGAGTIIISDTPFNQDGATHGVVLKFELSSTPASDTLSLYLDPPGSLPIGYVDGIGSGDFSEPALPTAVASGLDFTLGLLSSVTTFGASGILPLYDELRVGTTYADVVPPPSPAGPCDEAEYACYLAIISHMNLTGQTFDNGDLTNDGRVTIADFRYWKDRRTDLSFGSGSLSSVGVPEPASFLLGLLATMVLAIDPRCPRCSIHHLAMGA